MKIILLKNIQKLGDIGNIITVKSGYARNYLIPTGKALLANTNNIKILKNKKDHLKEKVNIHLFDSQFRINQIKSIDPINIFVQAGKEGKLFGSIGSREIMNKIISLNFKINKNEIYLENGPIRYLGRYKVFFRPHKDLFCLISINILPK